MLPAAVRHVLAAVPRLRPGTIMLTESGYLTALPGSDPDPSLTELAVWQVGHGGQQSVVDPATRDGSDPNNLARRG